MHIGYARVSSDDQKTAAQIEQLEKSGCERIYKENASGGRWDRPELQDCLKHIRKGDVLVVWKLDRLTRSLSDLLHILQKVEQAGAGFKSITEALDTTSPAGRMMTHMLASVAQFEREIIRERTKLGLEAARKAGRVGGRRYKLPENQRKEAVSMVNSGQKTQAQVARLFHVNRSVISRLLSQDRVIA